MIRFEVFQTVTFALTASLSTYMGVMYLKWLWKSINKPKDTPRPTRR